MHIQTVEEFDTVAISKDGNVCTAQQWDQKHKYDKLREVVHNVA